MKIYFINSKKENCGVYQYGLRLWDSIKHSKFDVSYFEIENFEEFLSLDFSGVDLLFFNFIEGGYTGPFGWYTIPQVIYVKDVLNIKTATVQHTAAFNTAKFDFVVNQDPDSGLPRPLYNYDLSKPKSSSKVTRICSFGFAGPHKGFDDVVRKVNEEFDEAVVNLHITNAYYGDRDGRGQSSLIEEIKSIPLKPGIQLNITTEFLSNEEILDFVNNNDILLLAYKGGGDPSSLPDYPISTNTPFSVTSMPTFKHVYNENIDFNKRTIKEILEYCKNEAYPNKLRELWSQENLVKYFDSVIEAIEESENSTTYSQVNQDRFVLKLIGKNGYFLDIGCGWDHSGMNSNTFLLEENGWSGVCIDGHAPSLENRRAVSKRANCVVAMLPQDSLSDILKKYNAPKTIDYVSLDIDPTSIIGLECFPFEEYEFKVMTFEHDSYSIGEDQKNRAHKILTDRGYYRLCDNVRVPEAMGDGRYFEDWWINPKFFSEEFIKNNTFEKALGSYVVENIKK